MSAKIRGCPTKYTRQTIPHTLYYMKNYASLGDEIPSIAGLAIYLNVGRRTLYDWGGDPEKQDFSHILEMLLAMQERALLNGGLSGRLNSNIVKLALGKHNYSERIESDNKNNTTLNATVGLSDLTEDELDRKIIELQNELERSTQD